MRLFAAKLLVLTVLSADAKPGLASAAEVQQLLTRLQQAGQSLDYDGQLVFARGTHVETMQVQQRHRGGSLYEKILKPSGHVHESLITAAAVYCVRPESRSLVEHGAPDAAKELVKRVLVAAVNPFYTLKWGGTQEIAGHSCDVLNILPNDSLRFGYRLCAEQRSGLLVKFLTLNHSGEVLEQMIFTHLELQPEPDTQPAVTLDELLQQGYQLQATLPLAKASQTMQTASRVVWNSTNLPAGFGLMTDELRQLSLDNPPVRHLVFDDGVAGISVFIDDSVDSASGSRQRLGALSAITRRVGENHLTLLGEVPLRTLEQLADAFVIGEQKTHD